MKRTQELNQQLEFQKNLHGTVEESDFEVLTIGSTIDTIDSTEQMGVHLFRLANPEKYSLEINLFDGRTGRIVQSGSTPFPEPQVGVTLLTLKSEIDGLSPVQRVFQIDRTENWYSPAVSQFKFEFEPDFLFSYKIEKGTIHDGSVLTYFFFPSRPEGLKYNEIQERSTEKLCKTAAKYKMKCVYFRIVSTEELDGEVQ